jgi:hypothetical protein
VHLHASGCSYDAFPRQLAGKKSTIKEMEVFQVTVSSKPKHEIANGKKMKALKNVVSGTKAASNTEKVQRFTPSINTALNQKWSTLENMELELSVLDTSFKDESNFITLLARGKDEELITLNVCGTIMITTLQTLTYEKSGIISKLLDQQVTYSTNKKPVKEWNAEDVVAWLNTVDGLSSSVVMCFQEDEVTGRELLALGKEDMVDFGITKKGTIAYLLSEIKKLERAQGDAAILIEHSPYCFEKIIDHFRLESMFTKGLIKNKPGLPVVRDSEKSRFEKVVKYYFPGDSSKSLFGN